MHLILDGVFSHVGKTRFISILMVIMAMMREQQKILIHLILIGLNLKIILLSINLGGELKIYLK